MSELDNHIQEISSVVWHFVDEISEGKVADELLDLHGVSDVAVNAIKTPRHVGINVYRKKIFWYLMERIGYYELLSQGSDKVASLTIDEVNERLYNPQTIPNFVKKQMSSYPLVSGIKESIDFINNSLPREAKCGAIGDIVPEGSHVEKVNPGYEISFRRQYDRNLDENFNQFLEHETFNIGQNPFKIQQHGCHISKWTRYFTQDDEIAVCLTHFNTAGVSPGNSYYQRYIAEISNQSTVTRNIGFGLVSLDRHDCNGSSININGRSFSVCFFSTEEKNYMAIDSDTKLTEREMREVAFSISVAIGLLTGHLFLGEYWMVASEDKDSRKPLGLFYSTLTPSVKSDYSIFTTNVYSVLIPIAKKIDSVNGEKRALSIINAYKLGCAIDPIHIDVFERIVENFERYESLQRGIYILLTGTQLSLELQPGAFSIALEAICNIAKEVIPSSKSFKVRDEVWEKMLPMLERVSYEQMSDGLITQEEHDFFMKKLESLNRPFNSDKLTSLLEHFGYPLTSADYDAIKFRNPLLHGDIKIKKMKGSDFDNLFFLSLRLHQLCCSIPLLMAGYEGYILNNCKLYGYDTSCKAFIRLGH